MGNLLGGLGVVFSALCAWFLYDAFSVEVTVATPDAPAGFAGVANLQLMHIQDSEFSLGIGCGIIAALFFVGAAIVSRLDRTKHPSASPD